MNFFSFFRVGTFAYSSITTLVVVLAISGCNSPKDTRYAPRHFSPSGTMLPAGVEEPVAGVHPVEIGKAGLGDTIGPPPDCCAVDRNARFRVAKTPAEHVLHAWIGVLDETHVVEVSFPGFDETHYTQRLASGLTDVSVRVPTALRGAHGLIPVRLVCRQSDPRSGDPCALTSVYFE